VPHITHEKKDIKSTDLAALSNNAIPFFICQQEGLAAES